MYARPTRLLLFLAALTALAAGVAACSDEEAGDDDDDTPITPTRCAIYWARENPVDGSLDFFAVDMPLAAWVTNTAQTYGGIQLNAREGTFVYRSPDGSLSAAMGVARTTSGSFALVMGAGTAAGDPVAFEDTSAQILVDARTETSPPAVGTGGAGSFSGVWSDPAATTQSEIDWATGTLTVTYLGSNLSLGGRALGGMSAYGQCYDPELQSFAPVPLQGGKLFLASPAIDSRSGTRHGKGSR